MEVLKERSIDERYVSTLSTAGPTWMIPFVENLKRGILPDYHDKAMKIHIKAPSYTLINRELYRKGFTTPWWRCIDDVKGMEALQEAHVRQAGAHKGVRALTGKVLRMGIYWPTAYQDTTELMRKCGECQAFPRFKQALRYHYLTYLALGRFISGE